MKDFLLRKHSLRLCPTFIQNFDTFSDAVVDPICIKPVLGEKEFGISVSNQAVGNTHANDSYFVLQSVFLEQFQNSGTKATSQVGLLHGNQKSLRASECQYQWSIKRFYKPCVYYSGFNSVFFQVVSGCKRRMNHGTVRDDRDFTAVAEQFSLTNFQHFWSTTDVNADPIATRVSHSGWAVMLKHC